MQHFAHVQGFEQEQCAHDTAQSATRMITYCMRTYAANKPNVGA
jgi:hypothetical protein